MVGDIPVPLPARTAVGALALRAVTAASASAARLAGVTDAGVDPSRIAVAYASERAFRLDGVQPTAFGELSAFFAARDGWVRTHATYPHHRRALQRALSLPADAGRDVVASELARRPAREAAALITGAGGLCVAVDRESPDADAALRRDELVSVCSLRPAAGTTTARPTPIPDGSAEAPLRGVQVLDLTRVIAGPVATRTLALLGADVLRIDPPTLPEIAWQHLDTGHGKRSALLDLTASADRQRFDSLLSSADVVVLGYRPRALDALGLSPASLSERRPGVIVARLTAWGEPNRRGFDSLVQAASGLAWIESPDGETPGVLPAQALDHSAGYLLAATIMTLLERRAAEGGSWLAETSLRRIAAELLGMPRRPEPADTAPIATAGHVQEFEVEGVAVSTAAPAVSYPGGPTAFAPPRPWGRDDAEWSRR